VARYYLHIRRNDELIEDEEGFEFLTLNEAQREALRGLRSILADALLSEKEPTADGIRIADGAGRELMVVSMAEVLPAKFKQQ
jgi:hypothetical protein